MKKWNKRTWIFFGVFVMVLFLGLFLWRKKGAEIKEAAANFLENGKSPQEEQNIDGEVYATSHTGFTTEEELEPIITEEVIEEPEKVSMEPLTNEIVKIQDIYVEKGHEILLKSFYPGATAYHWERYDVKTKTWKSIDSFMGMDELYREVSMCTVFGEESTTPIMLRCRVLTPEQEYEDIASVYVLDQRIESISVPICEANTGQYLSAREVPVKLTFADGSQEEISGLYGLYWIEERVETEYSEADFGGMVETVTTVLTDREYRYIEQGKNDVRMQYRLGDKKQDIEVEIEGKDMIGPDILTVQLSDYQVSREDKAVPIQVTITAVDNCTNYANLQYCFLPEGEEPKEDDWLESSSWEAAIDKNGTWIAYVKDEHGNITTAEREIIAVDEKAPLIKLSLENTDWCKETKILVKATDSLDLQYCYSCVETGENSGWIGAAEYSVRQNGTWAVSAKDALGNTATKEIIISNIDQQMPVIHGISITTDAEGEKE